MLTYAYINGLYEGNVVPSIRVLKLSATERERERFTTKQTYSFKLTDNHKRMTSDTRVHMGLGPDE